MGRKRLDLQFYRMVNPDHEAVTCVLWDAGRRKPTG
jgi:hypothetical protein